jgi:hypothetical protein
VKLSPRLLAALIVVALPGRTLAQPAAATKDTGTPPAPASAVPDPASDPIARIRDEGLNRSQVEATLGYLTNIIGPRLTGSPALRRANAWSRDRLTAWGLSHARLEPWGPFGRGWSLRRFSAQVIAPQSIPLIAYPKAWSPGVGPQTLVAEIVHTDIKKSEDFAQFRGKLRGKVVLDGPIQEVKLGFEPLAVRRNAENLLELANAGEGATAALRPPTSTPMTTPAQKASVAFLPRRYQFFAEEGVAVLLQPSRLGDGGSLVTTAATVYAPATTAPDKSAAKASSAPGAPTTRSVSPWTLDCPPITPQVNVAAEHYNRLVRMLEQGERLRVAIELQADFHPEDPMVANTLAEIPGSDLADELVMLGAHLDSWHSGTGSTDNAAGSAVAMEAVRILQALELKPRRTIRIALWSGEEQGLLGSKAYVTEHFGSVKSDATANPAAKGKSGSTPAASGRPAAVEKKAAHGRLSAYFNLDNGTGKIRGIFLQGNEAARPIFRQWLAPFRDLGAETVSLATTGSTDHVPFDAVGLPGFQFIQDQIEYRTKTHHANMDVYDRASIDDLKQAAVIMAAFVYQTAMRDEKIPRKPGAAPAGGSPSGKTKKAVAKEQ